jgi:hypothetical protein
MRRQFLFDHRLDKTTHPRARICLDRIKPVVENIFFSRRGISRYGVISRGAGAPILLLGSAGDYVLFEFQSSATVPDAESRSAQNIQGLDCADACCLR